MDINRNGIVMIVTVTDDVIDMADSFDPNMICMTHQIQFNSISNRLRCYCCCWTFSPIFYHTSKVCQRMTDIWSVSEMSMQMHAQI